MAISAGIDFSTSGVVDDWFGKGKLAEVVVKAVGSLFGKVEVSEGRADRSAGVT